MLLARLEVDARLFRYCTGVSPAKFEVMLELAEPLMTIPRTGHPWKYAPNVRLIVSLLYPRSNQPMKLLEAVTGIDDSVISRCVAEAARVWEKIGFTPPPPDPDWQLPASAGSPCSGGDGPGSNSIAVGSAVRSRPAVCVDGFLVGCPRPQGWEEQRPYFSVKHHRHGYKMQAVTVNGRLASLSAPELGSTHDAALLSANPIPPALVRDGQVYGDKAYSRDQLVRPRKRNEGGFDAGINRLISTVRVAVEHRIKDVKDFKLTRHVRLGDARKKLVGLGNLISAALNLEPHSRQVAGN